MKKENEQNHAEERRQPIKETETNVVIEMPDEVVVTLVQENLVKNYELPIWLFNVSMPIATALWTAFFTIGAEKLSSLFFSSLAFSAFSAVLLVLIIRNRKRTFSETVRRSIKISDFNKK